jgi:O-antigen biosynthesis protein
VDGKLNSKSRTIHDHSTTSSEEIKKLRHEVYHLKYKFKLAQNLYTYQAKSNINYIFYLNKYRNSFVIRVTQTIGSYYSKFLGNLNKSTSIKSAENQFNDSNVNYVIGTSESDREKIFYQIDNLTERPLISIILLADQANPDYKLRLDTSIKSITNQIYPNWQLIVISRGSKDPELEKLTLNSKNVFAHYFIEESFTFDNFLNCYNIVDGEFTTIMHCGDIFTEQALFEFALASNDYSEPLLIYGDEAKIVAENIQTGCFFKPGWNLELFLRQNYLNRAICFNSHAFLDQIKTFSINSLFELERVIFRMATKLEPNKISHIPTIVMHTIDSDKVFNWRDFKRTQFDVEEYMLNRQITCSVNLSRYCNDWLELTRMFPTQQSPSVSIIIPTKNNATLLEKCIEGILNKTNYEKLEILIIDNQNDNVDALHLLSKLSKLDNITLIDYDKPFNYSDMNNIAAQRATGSILIFMNDDIEIVDENWLCEVLQFFIESDCGIVGPKLLYPNRTVQHAAIVCGFGGVAGHPQTGIDENNTGYYGNLVLTRETSAVTGACLAIRKKLFFDVGGMDAVYLKKKFNDVDLCLKVRAAGYRIIWTPNAVLIHHESASLGQDVNKKQFESLVEESECMLQRWDIILDDPYYNPNLTLYPPGYEITSPRRPNTWNV